MSGAVLSIYGAAYWLIGAPGREEPPITRTRAREWAAVAAGTVLTAMVLVAVRPDDNRLLALLDVVSGALLLAALVLQARKRLEGWLVNAAAVLVSWPIFYLSGAPLFTWATPLFIAALLANHVQWRRLWQAEKGMLPPWIAHG